MMNVHEIIGKLALLLQNGEYKTAWSASGELTKGSSKSVKLQVSFRETGAYTVQFSINGKDLINTGLSRKTRATITWSVEGNSVRRVIDVVNGTSISGTAQAVTVEINDISTGGGQDTYVVATQVVKGTRPDTQQPPYLTHPRFQIEGGDTTPVVVPIPLNSGVVSVRVLMFPIFIGSELPANPEYDYEVIHSQGAGATAMYSPLLITDWVSIASGTTSLKILQSADGIGMNYNVTFGIDG